MNPIVVHILTAVAVALSLAGTWANAKRKRWGFLCWVCANTFWVTYNVYHGMYAQAALFAVYFGLAVYGWERWKKD